MSIAQTGNHLMKAILLSLFCFFGIAAFSQNATSSVHQRISFRLMDRAIVEKKPAVAANGSAQAAVQVQSGSQWIVRTKEADAKEEMIAAGEDNNGGALTDDTAAIVYTVSKL